MIRNDGAYALTRRRGKTGTITRVTSSSANAETGARTDVTASTTVRWLFRGATNWSRLYRAEMTQQRVGDVTFIMWLPDVQADFTELRQEDKIIQDGKTYEVVSSTTEDEALVVTAREFA